MSSYPEIIVYSNEFAPRPQKLFHFLALFNIPFKYVEVPKIMPRPQLAGLGITYRRTPLLSIGSDMYIDTQLIISHLAKLAQDGKTDSGLQDNFDHLEFEALGEEGLHLAAFLMPLDMPEVQDPKFLADRSELMGAPFDPREMLKVRPQTISKTITFIHLVEHNFLRDGSRQFVLGGTTPTTADLYLYWSLNWGLRYHQGSRPEISPQTYPLIFKWLDDVEFFIKPRRQDTKITIEDASKILLPQNSTANDTPASVVSHVKDNPEKLSQGQKVKVTPTDSGKSGLQLGSLIGLNYEEIVLKNEKGLIMHFPRRGYEIVAA